MNIEKFNQFLNESKDETNLRKQLVELNYIPIKDSELLFEEFRDNNVVVSQFNTPIVNGYAIKYSNGQIYSQLEELCRLNVNMVFFTWGPGNDTVIGQIYIDDVMRYFTLK